MKSYLLKGETKVKFKSDMDFVVFYAEEILRNSKLFDQHKKFIESQMNASKELFYKFGKGENFKLNAREYLKGRGLI